MRALGCSDRRAWPADCTFRLEMTTRQDSSRAFEDMARRVFTRERMEDLGSHLEEVYGISVDEICILDVGVARVRSDGPPWIARVMSAARPAAATAADAAFLKHLACHDFPAERLASAEPISTMAGQQVLVTEFIPSVRRKIEPDIYQLLGRLHARLHTLPLPTGAAARPAGSLHHHAEGPIRNEITAAAEWLDQIETRLPASTARGVARLRTALEEADDAEGLPEAVIHPDPALVNLVRTVDGYACVDWTGAGVGPRLASLAYLLGSPKAAPRIMEGYAEIVELTDAERERLPTVAATRPLIGLVWNLGFSPPEKAEAILGRLSGVRRNAAKLAAAALAVG